MKIFDSVPVKIIDLDDSAAIYLPIEYFSLSGSSATLSAGTEGNDLVFIVKPDIKGTVRETVDELWRDIRILFSKIADIGDTAPWGNLEIVWDAQENYVYDRVPISAVEVLEHRRMRFKYKSEPNMDFNPGDMRKSIHETLTKLCEIASSRLDFKDPFFTAAFGDSVANKFALVSCMYGPYDVICEIFSEEFHKVDEEKYWSLTSEKAGEAVAYAYKKIKYLESHPEEFERERARIQEKWGFPLKASP